MPQLTKNNLPKRQQELNIKVNEAALKNVDFESLKAEPELSDVDRLFKLDLAAKYKNVEYIIEVLKSGDSLCISRALKKSVWLYDDKYSNIINADYLHHNLFPFMSNKMQKKFLSTVSIHLTNESQAADFYKYCRQNNLVNNAYKFLILTSESFKLKILKEQNVELTQRDEKYLINFFGNSFALFNEYLVNYKWSKNNILQDCSYFYAVSDIKYLDLLEKYVTIGSNKSFNLGLRISKQIVTKHKDRILANPQLYVNILNIQKLARHSTINEIKLYAVSVLPNEVSEFWRKKYYEQYKPIIDAIPAAERYDFVKKIFTDKYNEEFEMTRSFYDQKYFILMTSKEKEEWALRQIAIGNEILGPGCDYIWYKFVNFERAFVEVKKAILSTSSPSYRSDILKVLAESAKSHRELEKLFNYYYERHVNENKTGKEGFLRKAISIHNVFEFDRDSWAAFNKIFYSIGVYDTAEDNSCNPDFKIVAILYHIINNIEMPSALVSHIENEISIYSIKDFLQKNDAEKKQAVYNYMYNFYLERIRKIDSGGDNMNVQYIHFLLEFMAMYKKTKENVPEVVMKYINSNWETYRYQQILESPVKDATENDFVRDLKQDSSLLTSKIPEVKKVIINNWNLRLNSLIHKLKTYFYGEEVVIQFLKLFNDLLNQDSLASTAVYVAVYGIFQLNDEKSNIDFMNKFAPKNPKINHVIQKENVLRTQEAICRFAGYARPPVPISSILLYLQGDYVQYCLPIFNMYQANLPLPLCMNFIEALLDTPVSIQKHGLRLAFKNFSVEELGKLVSNAWKKSKNVSLRSVIYKALFEKITNENNKELFQTLKMITLDLKDEDDDALFEILVSNKIPHEFLGVYLETAWLTVEKFKDNKKNVERKTFVLRRVNDSLHLIDKETIKKFVIDHINAMFDKRNINLDPAKNMVPINVVKWQLVAHYIVRFTSNEEDLCECIQIVKLILHEFLQAWNVVVSDFYVHRHLLAEFVQNLKCPYLPYTKSFENAIPVFESILSVLQGGLPLQEIYIHIWDLRVTIITRQVVGENRDVIRNDERREHFEEAAVMFGKKVGNLVEEFVENDIYFAFITDEITKLIKESAFELMRRLNEDTRLGILMDDVLISIARGLLESNVVKNQLLALQILPVNPESSLQSYRLVFDTLRKLDNKEVQCYLYQKYSGDCKRRRFE